MKRFFNVVLFTSVFLLTACEKTVINHGYIIESSDFSNVIPKEDTALTVYRKFGTPTMSSSVPASDGSYNWYYVAKRTEKTGFLSPKVLDERTVIVSFNKMDIVTSVETIYPGKTGEKVEMLKEKTEVGGKTAGVLGETFGGLGKYMKRYTEADKNKR